MTISFDKSPLSVAIFGCYPTSTRLSLQLLMLVHVATCCILYLRRDALFDVSHFLSNPTASTRRRRSSPRFHSSPSLFVFADFSCYFVGFHLYTVIVGYLWLNCFSEFGYNHYLAGLSAATSAIAFLLPALFIRGPLRRPGPSPLRLCNRSVNFILLLAVRNPAVGANYNFRLVGVGDIYSFRDTLNVSANSELSDGDPVRRIVAVRLRLLHRRKKSTGVPAPVLFLLACFYPITLSKLALFTPAWLGNRVTILEVFRFQS